MAVKNKVITNHKTGQQIRFVQTGRDTAGQLLEMESTYPSFSKEPPAHYHPSQDEDFTVVSGALTVRVKSGVVTLRAGETLHIPANAVHSMWNGGEHPAVVNWKVMPALETEYFFETLTGIANESSSNADGRPSLLQFAITAKKYRQVFRLAKPPYAVQKIVFGLLSAVAKLRGFKPDNARYFE